MRKAGWLIISMGVLGFALGIAHGETFTIDDTPGSPTAYWGGTLNIYDFSSNKDVLNLDSSPSFDLTKMEVTFSGTRMQVKIMGPYFTNYFYEADGDLFLSSKGWKVSGTDPHHGSDTFTKDEGWDYVVSSSPLASYRGIWKLDWTSLYWTEGGRKEQAYYKDAGGVKVGDATVIRGADSITFDFDYTGLDSLGPNSFGVHFTEACGNDVIEGGSPPGPVPAPPTLYVSMVGLVGFALMRKKILR